MALYLGRFYLRYIHNRSRMLSIGTIVPFTSSPMTPRYHQSGAPEDIRDFAFFVFERTKHQPRRNLRSYLVLQRLCNEAALSPGIDAFWY